MPPVLALILCIGIVIALLVIEHKHNSESSIFLWIPTIWLLICGSRPLGYWFESGIGSTLEEGSPYDRIVLSALIILAIVVLYRRKVEWRQVIKNNYGLILLYTFLGISIFWSDDQYISFKRWVRLLGAIPIALVVLSEKSPFDALESLFRRCAYILIPFSLTCIKYFPNIGTSYGRWSGLPSWTGVTTTKNSLGQLCAISAFFIIWSYIKDKKEKRIDKFFLRRPADIFILSICLFLLAGIGGAFSATSSAMLAAGCVMLLVLYGFEHSRPKLAATFLIATISAWLLLIYSDLIIDIVTSLLKRDVSFTGRADIWKLALYVGDKNPWLGKGFGGYWVTGNEISETFGGYLTAHNGLLDAYLEIGIVGIILLIWFHFVLYLRFMNGLTRNSAWAIFGICFLIMSLLYNYTESIFLKSSLYIWNITIFLALIFVHMKGKRKAENN